jgi:hypothetical protein
MWPICWASRWRPLEQEPLRMALLDTKHRILGTRTVYQGSVNQAQVRVPIWVEHARLFIAAEGRALTRSSHLHVGIDGWLWSEVGGAGANGTGGSRVSEGFCFVGVVAYETTHTRPGQVERDRVDS